MTASIKRLVPPALAILAGALVILPAILFGVPNNNDLSIHYQYAMPFYDALRQGHLYPGWLGTLNLGYGDDVVRFYPPALYYLLAMGRAITGNWYAGLLFPLTLVSALGSLGAYFWAGTLVPRRTAVWAAVFYALMPYHLAEFYQAAQLAEFTGGAAFLFAFGFTIRICDHGRWRDVAGLAAAYAALILSHLPLAVFGSLTLPLYTLMSIQRNRSGGSLVRLILAVLGGLAASAFYWVTMVSELKWIIGDGANPDPLVDYRRNFVFSTLSAEKQETIWWMGLLAIATIAMCIPAVGAFVKERRKSLTALAILLVVSLLMMTAVSKPLWAVIPYLDKTQHPFRWLAVASAVAPILMAASVPFWSRQLRQRKRRLALVMTGLVLIAVTFSVSQTIRGATYLSRPKLDQMLTPLKAGPGIIQWLPVWAARAASDKPTYARCVPPIASDKIDAAGRSVRINEWTDLKRRFEVEAGNQVDARVATFFYPHWFATVNGRALPTHPDKEGAILISLPPEKAIVELEFREPLRTKLSATISIISWTLIGSLLIFGFFSSTRRDYESIATRRDATE